MDIKITQESLKEVLQYYPITGNFRWIKKIRNINIGDIAGSVNSRGYIQIKINKVLYTAHRLSFLYMNGEFPENQVDHKDHIKINNRWLNLKEVTNQENSINRSRCINNISGTMGVSWNKINSNWRALITYKGNKINLGSYAKKKDAIKARKKAEKKYGFHPNHGKRERVQLINN